MSSNTLNTPIRTLWASHLATLRYAGKPFTLLPNTTLNQKFNIGANEKPMTNEYPMLNGIVIGNSGCYGEMKPSGTLRTVHYNKKPTHAALFRHIPFIVRPIDNDLSATVRAGYGLRYPFAKDGVKYVAYFLKRLHPEDWAQSTTLTSVGQDGIISNVDEYIPDVSALTPVVPTVSNGTLITATGDYVGTTLQTKINLNENDIREIVDAVTIFLGDPELAVISEMGVTHGIMRQISGQFGSVTSQYVESVCTQISMFAPEFSDLNSSAKSLEISLSCGNMEPLLT